LQAALGTPIRGEQSAWLENPVSLQPAGRGEDRLNEPAWEREEGIEKGYAKKRRKQNFFFAQ